MLNGVDVIRVCTYRDGSMIAAKCHGRDADESGLVDVSGYAARLVENELRRAGSRGRARSGLEKVLRAARFSDPSLAFVQAMDRLRETGVSPRGLGNGRGGLTYYHPEAQS